MSRFRQRLQHPAVAWFVALATLYLAALPTVYGVYADDLTAHHLGLRPPLTILWFLGAIGVGLVATVHERWTDRVLERFGDRVASKRRKDATLRAVEALLQPGATGLSPCFRFSAFQPDQHDVLVPIYQEEVERWERWPPGAGVVGKMWELRDDDLYILMQTTEAVRQMDATLTAEQRERYGHLTMVAARRILDESDRPIGVLGVACDDDTDFVGEGGLEAHRVLASDLGVLLGDVIDARA